MEIIAAIGAESTQGLQTHAFDAEFRLKSLELQKLAVEALLQKAPERGKDWASSLALLADAWLREAEFSYHYDYSTSLGPRMQYDAYGNIYYSNYDPFTPEMMARQRGMPMALRGRRRRQEHARRRLAAIRRRRDQAQVRHRLRRALPEGQRGGEGVSLHRAAVEDQPAQGQGSGRGVRPGLDQEPRPELAATASQPFFYIYGFDNRAEGIPLTRSKQERNLVELAGWVKRLRKLPIAEIDEKLLTKAFTTCHSTAEVYRLDAIERSSARSTRSSR